jgi:hypothetical protein
MMMIITNRPTFLCMFFHLDSILIIDHKTFPAERDSTFGMKPGGTSRSQGPVSKSSYFQGDPPPHPVFSLRSARCHWYSCKTVLTVHPGPKDLLVCHGTLDLLSCGKSPRKDGLASVGPSYDVLSWDPHPRYDHVRTGPSDLGVQSRQ